MTAQPLTTRAAITNDPRRLRGFDGRSIGGRRRRDLIDAFVAALGGAGACTDVTMVAVVRAAELTAVAEEARAAALKGDPTVDLGSLVRIEGAADRAVRALGLKAVAAAKVPGLAEHLAKRAAERAGEPPGAAA
jgi:tagatose-1,6-bisphosphate aldolase non-catalytic subunit AgaZ/GatZ